MNGFLEQFAHQAGIPKFHWVALALVVFASWLGSIVPDQRKKLRNSVVLFGVSCVGLLLALGLFKLNLVAFDARGKPDSISYVLLHWISLLLGWIAFINVVSVLVVDVLLRTLTLELPRLVRDLLLALIYVVTAFSLLSREGVQVGNLLVTSTVITAVVAFSLCKTRWETSSAAWRCNWKAQFVLTTGFVSATNLRAA